MCINTQALLTHHDAFERMCRMKFSRMTFAPGFALAFPLGISLIALALGFDRVLVLRSLHSRCLALPLALLAGHSPCL